MVGSRASGFSAWMIFCAVRRLGIGHDGRGVAVEQHDLVALFPEGFARLGARVIKLAGLADHDWTGSNDQDGVDIVSSGHGGRFLSLA